MKNRRITKIICLILTVVLTVMVIPVWAISDRVPIGETEGVIVDENPNLIYATLTSAIDGLPFLAFFDKVTGKISFFGMDGESRGFRYAQVAVITFILGERLYAGTERGSIFWIELNERYGREKYDEVKILGFNRLDIKGDWLRSAPMREEIQLPPLYRLIHYFEISEEVFMAYHTIDANIWSNRCFDFIRLMFLPEDEMRAALLNKRGAIFNGTVNNIFTLNELFQTDREAFAQIDLQELVQFQKNLESMGIFYGLNAEMVEFANTYNVNSASTR